MTRIRFSPSMPDVMKKDASAMFEAEDYFLMITQDVWPIGGGRRIAYPYVLTLIDKVDSGPAFFVTLENSSAVTNVLCAFESNGSHSNFGPLEGEVSLERFADVAIGILKKRLDLGEVKRLSPKSRKPWWKVW